MNPRRRAILSILALVVIAAAGGFILFQLQDTQAPDDTAASGGTCCTGGSCNNGETFGEGTYFGSCQQRADEFCNQGRGGTANPGSENPTGCGRGNPDPPPPPPGGQCAGALQPCSFTSGGSTCCDGLVCQNGVNGQLRCEDPGDNDPCPGGGTCTAWISFSCDQLTNGQCLENPVDGYNPGHVNGCGQIDQVCDGGDRNRQLCGDFQIFDDQCGLPPVDPFCGDGNVDPGEECDPPGSTVGDQICDGNCRLQDIPPEPFCGDGNADPGEECDPPGSLVNGQICNSNCQLVDPPPDCGDAVCQTGEICELTGEGGTETRLCQGNNQPPTGDVIDTCDLSTCTYEPLSGEEAITVIKEGVSVCNSDGVEDFTYSITVTNIGDVETEYTNIEDQLDPRLSPDMVSDISNGGTLSGTTITWPGGPLAVGESIGLTYTVSVPPEMVSSLNGILENTVIVDYGITTTDQVSFTNRENLTCGPEPELPQTDLNDYSMYIIAFALISSSLLVYRVSYGNEKVEWLASKAGKFTEKLSDSIAITSNKRQKVFEKHVLKDKQKK